MKKLAVLGASGHGKVVADLAEVTGWNEVVFFDDSHHMRIDDGRWPILGDSEQLCSTLAEYDGVIVAIGDNNVRFAKLELLKELNAPLVSLIHPGATVSAYAQIGVGCVVMAGAIINIDVVVSDGVIINTASSVDHDCILGTCVHICPGVNLAGSVIINERSWIGIGASVRQSIFIGKDVLVGAGAAVVTNLPDSVTAVGVPARF
ncbi:MAG: acetyltransferase [Pseudomonadales bacterium]|jgi:sugar O-acyltransferase (sialic acid O-acetyltransferase NeuD family)